MRRRQGVWAWQCKQDFCWVCLGPWKKHSTETGGYFRCNRYDETKKQEAQTDAALSQAKVESKKAAELNRFIHYYTRFKNHLNSHTVLPSFFSIPMPVTLDG